MDIFGVLNMICGLALFLYGMHIMGDGLTRMSGGKLETILEKLTNNTLKAVLLGAAVTAVIQSSSATTVMVVGFVNSGIMKLSQAAGVIMGANIGTTITSWILSLTGIESGNLLVQLCKPSSFTPVLAIVGVGFLLKHLNDPQPFKDAATTVLSIIAQALMALAFMEQWVLWITVNAISVVMWCVCVARGEAHAGIMVIMWCFYLLNSINGLRVWLKLSAGK